MSKARVPSASGSSADRPGTDPPTADRHTEDDAIDDVSTEDDAIDDVSIEDVPTQGAVVNEGRVEGLPVGAVQRRRRGYRRATVPPTNPEADRSDDAVRRPGTPEGTDPEPRDAWIREQRPPHWD